jgi:glycine oxidase
VPGSSAARTTDVVVVGGGVIGLAIAWQAALRGLTVTVLDPAPGSGASHAAAGMLAPVTEVHYGEERLLRLNLASAQRYPTFAAELTEATGRDVGYRQTGTLAVATDADDRAVLADLHRFQLSLGLAVELLTSREARRLEPMLAPGIRSGLLVAGDHQVDNRLLAAALLAAAIAVGVDVRTDRVAGIVTTAERATGVRLGDGDTLAAGTVVLAAGCWSGQVAGVPTDVAPPTRPVKGQIVRLRGPADFLGRNVRAVVGGTHLYLVPRADGEIVIGATTEEQGYDVTVRAGGVYELLRDAHTLVPGIAELELTETYAGLRPGSPDNAPMIGRTALAGLVAATGHYRNGILLTPATADAVADLLATGVEPEVIRPFSPQRFARERVRNMRATA